MHSLLSTVGYEFLFGGSLLVGFAFSLLLFLFSGRMRLRIPRGLKLPLVHRAYRSYRSHGSDRSQLPYGPVALGTFLTLFGLFGLTAHVLMRSAGGTSLLASLLLSIPVTLAFLLLLTRLTASGKPMQGQALVGSTASVSLAIPDGGVGSIAYVSEGKRHTIPARAPNGQAVEKGQRVLVTGLSGSIALVEEF